MVDNQNDSKFIKILERFKHLYANLMVGVIVFCIRFLEALRQVPATFMEHFGGKSEISKTVRSHLDPSLKTNINMANGCTKNQITLNPMPNLHISPHICLSNEAQDHQNFWLSHWGESFYIKHIICAPVWGTQLFPLFLSIKQPGLEIFRKFPHATGRHSWSQRHVQVEILHIFRRPRNSRIVWRTMAVSK